MGKPSLARIIKDVDLALKALEIVYNRDILHSLHFHCVLSRFVLDVEGTDEEERNMHFSFSKTKEIARGLKGIW